MKTSLSPLWKWCSNLARLSRYIITNINNNYFLFYRERTIIYPCSKIDGKTICSHTLRNTASGRSYN